MTNSRYSSMVASRICHDLINPVGAIANGVELLEMAGGTQAELDLISDGVFHTSARVRFFRIAFGLGDHTQMIPTSEVQSIFEDNKSERVNINWQVEQARSRPEIRAVFLTVMCLEHALPRGGDLRVDYRNGWSVVADAEIVDADMDHWGPLSRGEAPLTVTPNSVPFALLPETLRDLGYEITILISNSRLSVHFD